MSQSSSESQNLMETQSDTPQDEVMTDKKSAPSEIKISESKQSTSMLSTKKSENPKILTEDTLVAGLLINCAKNGDKANSKLAQKTIENIKKNGFEGALEQMAKDCFKHPDTDQPLSYGEMRMFYG